MKKTLVLRVDAANLGSNESEAALELAASILRGGGTVAFPTETVYGLGANALAAEAVRGIFEAKQRPGWDPLIVHVARSAQVESVAAAISDADRRLMQAFWPGPLSLLLPRSTAVPGIVTAGRAKVGVRVPAHPVAQALLRRAGVPVAAPSANSFGRTSPTTAQHVLEDLDGRINAVVDGGPTNLGLESTVMDANARPPVIYRQGMVSIEALRHYLPEVVAFNEALIADAVQGPAALPSPGVGLRHYAPRARLVLIDAADVEEALGRAAEASVAAGRKTGVLLPLEFRNVRGTEVFAWGSWADADGLAQRLFAGLRWLDGLDVDQILCPVPAGKGIAVAIRDRLRKASMTK